MRAIPGARWEPHHTALQGTDHGDPAAERRPASHGARLPTELDPRWAAVEARRDVLLLRPHHGCVLPPILSRAPCQPQERPLQADQRRRESGGGFRSRVRCSPARWRRSTARDVHAGLPADRRRRKHATAATPPPCRWLSPKHPASLVEGRLAPA